MEAYLSRSTDEDRRQQVESGWVETSVPCLSDQTEARSAHNIRTWREYLPDDCIGMMISMGWDQDT
jgi:hypothetical protein